MNAQEWERKRDHAGIYLFSHAYINISFSLFSPFLVSLTRLYIDGSASPMGWSATNQQSQAGKSFFLLDLARFFCPLFSLSKITELVYVCNSISPKYKQCLEDVGKQLQIDVHVCVGGISSEKFQTSWNARMERYKRTQKSVITDGIGDINEDDDDDDDDDDELKLSTSRETGSSNSKQKNNDDGCVDFIQRMLDQRRKDKHAPLASRSNQQRQQQSDETSLALHGILPGRKPRGRHASLRSKPRIRGGVRNFLTLTDRRLQGLASIALRKSAEQRQQQPRRTSNATLKGGLMATRSSTLKQRRQHIEQGTNDLLDVGADASPAATTTTKAGSKRKRTLGGRKTDGDGNDRPTNDKRAKKDEAATAEAAMVHVDDDVNDDGNDAHSRGNSSGATISFRPGCLLFLDDIFVAQSSLHHHRSTASNVNETRSNDRNELLDAVGLASQISLELSHHMQV